MTHTIIILELATNKTQFIAATSFAVDFSVHEKEGHIVGVCLAGGEGEALQDMFEFSTRPEPEVDYDYEPEYTLAGGWAAYDAR